MAANDELTAGGESAAQNTVASDNEVSTNAQSVPTSNETSTEMDSNENENNNQPAKTNMEKNFANNEINHAGEAGIVTNNLKSVPVIALSQVEALGYQLAVTTANRFVDYRQVNKLSSLEEVKNEHGFRHYGEVVLASNCEGEIELADLDGKPLPADTDLSKTLIIVDGQHRTAVAKANGWDVQYLLLPHIDNLVDYIKSKNTNSLSWKTQDFRHSYAIVSGKKDVLAEKAVEASYILPGGSESFYNFALQKGSDVRKANVVKGELPEFDENIGDDMMQLLEGLAFLSRKDNDLLRAIRKRSFLKGLFEASQKFSVEGTELGFYCKAFFLNLSEEEQQTLTKDFTKSTPEFKALKEGLKKLKDAGKDAVQKLIDDKTEELEKVLELNRKKAEAKKPKCLKSILSYQMLALETKEDSLKKAQKRVGAAEEAVKSANERAEKAAAKTQAAEKALAEASDDKDKGAAQQALDKAEKKLKEAQDHVAKAAEKRAKLQAAAETAKAELDSMVTTIGKATSTPEPEAEA